MNIALVALTPDDGAGLMAFVEENHLTAASVSCWQIQGEYHLAEQLLAPLERIFRYAAVDMILFPAGLVGDELATRLAWRLRGCALCQATAFDGTVSKAVYAHALTAKLQPEASPLCLSLAQMKPGAGRYFHAQGVITPEPLRATLPVPEEEIHARHPLQTAGCVLACGQGTAGVDATRIAAALGAEVGYSRQRVMAGGCDEQRMLGISGQYVAPSVCLVAGASGASAFMAGIAGSAFIVAINQDPAAQIFAAADVGIVGDAEEVLDALATIVS